MESYTADSRESTLSSALSERIVESGEGGRGQWRRRLARHMHYPDETEVTRFMNNVATPAIEEVAAELEKQGARVSCSRGTVPGTDMPHMDLHVFFGDRAEFKYQVYPIAYSVPSFAPRLRTRDETYYQVEIFSATGSLGHDVFGYSQEQIITDVIDSYERHLAVLTMNEEAGSPVTMEVGQVPNDWDHDRTRTSEITRPTEGDS